MGWTQVERIVTTYLGIINLGFGIAILVGGAIRFPPPTYQPLLDMTGGQVWPYGAMFLASGVLLAWGQSWTAHLIGAVLGIMANSAFSALFLVAVLTFPDAGATAWWAYFAFASQSAAVACLLWTHRRVPRTNDARR